MKAILSITFAAALALVLPAGPAGAQGSYDLANLDSGQILLNLSASEQAEVEQDTLIATLQYTAQGRDKTALQDEVNTAVAEALAALEEATDVEYSTGQYHVYIYQPGRPARTDIENPVWRAQQSIRLISTNSGALLEIAGRLQEQGLHMSGLRYTLSDQLRGETADELLAQALENLQSRADGAARSLNKGSAELIEVTIDGGQGGYRVDSIRSTAMAADAESIEPPSASPGMTTVSVSVSARALLNP